MVRNSIRESREPRDAGAASSYRPFGEGELDCVLDEAVATRADDKGGSRLDAMLHHHVGCDATCMEGNLMGKRTKEKKKAI